MQRFQRVTGDIYRGGEPSDKDLEMLKNVHGIKTIISLDNSIGQKIAPIVKSLGMRHLIIPLVGSETGITDSLNYLVRNITNILGNNQPVFIHCLHGSDRTGLAIALYRVLHDGWACEQALSEARRFGFGLQISPATQNLYKKLVCNFVGPKATTDTNAVQDLDIVEQMRDTFQMGDVAPAFNPQQSWAPKIDIQKQWSPWSPLNSQEDRFQELKSISDQIDSQVPLVGFYDNWSGIKGVGPVETGGFLQL